MKFLPSVLIHSKAADGRWSPSITIAATTSSSVSWATSMVYTSAIFGDENESLEAAQDAEDRPGRREAAAQDRATGCSTSAAAGERLVAHLARPVRRRRHRRHAEQEAGRVRHGADQARTACRSARACSRSTTATSRGPLRQDLLPGDGRARGREELPDVPATRSTGCSRTTACSSCRSPACAAPEALAVRNDRGGYWDASDFIWGLFMNKYIFPGADAAHAALVVSAPIEKAGFEIHTVENVSSTTR